MPENKSEATWPCCRSTARRGVVDIWLIYRLTARVAYRILAISARDSLRSDCIDFRSAIASRV
jgi:hypothetical protein